MRSGHARLGLLVAALSSLFVACSSGGGGPECKGLDTACTAGSECCTGVCYAGACAEADSCEPLGNACATATDCCEGACQNSVCVDPDASGCKPVGGACTVPGDCCTDLCAGGICIDGGGCFAPGDACTGDQQCCTGACVAGKCGDSPTPTCGLKGVTCTDDEQCCSSVCASGTCTSSSFCTASGNSCDSDLECCSLNCIGESATAHGTCDGNACVPGGQPAVQAWQCCSKLLVGGVCQELGNDGTKYACTTLGETCSTGVECCSRNCQGGTCIPAYSCNAPGDICLRAEDCCSGMCTADNDGSPGRCLAPDGGCTQDGVPCSNNSNCCTRKCVDLGAGATVCQPAGGCRMTGAFCDSTAACCGGTNEEDPGTQASTYGVYCDGPSSSGTPPEFDRSSKNDRTCSNGQSCNPPGNICGAFGDNASQNCCVPGDFNGSGKVVCKLDSNEIPRCFGSPPGGGTGTDCPTGYDPANPLCCKPIGEVCQFRDQCCDSAPCVPDAQGVLRCAAPGTTCDPRGTPCDGPSDTSCCEGTTCVAAADLGYFCTDGQGNNGQCIVAGGGCAANTDCCSGSCSGGVCNPPAPPCQAEAASCTVDADCCSGLSCDIAPGATAGVCKSPISGPICAGTGQACTVSSDCCNAPGEECVEGACGTPPPLCGGLTQACQANGDCCEGLYCNAAKECAEMVCAATGASCTLTNPLCCESGATCRVATNPAQECTTGASCACVNMSVCAPSLGSPCAPTPGCCDSSTYCADGSSIRPCDSSSTSCVCKKPTSG